MTPAERAVIAAAIRWNEIHDASNAPDKELCDAVEALVSTEDPDRWADVLKSYDNPRQAPTVVTLAKRCKMSRMEGKHMVTCNRIAGGELDGRACCLACLRDRKKAAGTK